MARLPVKKSHTNRSKKRGAKDVDQERVKQQKLYYYERQLHKAVKKAREFEIRKVSRRLKQALDSQAKDGTPNSSQTAAAQKLQNQLDAVKSLGLDDLAKQAVNTVVQNGEHISAQQPEQPPRQESQEAALVRARILSAKCVQETLEVARQALARVEAAAAKLPSTDVQLTVEPEEAALAMPSGSGSSDAGVRNTAHASASSGDEASDGRPEDAYEAPSSSADELSVDAEELAVKRRKLLGMDGEGAQKAIGQKKKPEPPPPKKKKNRLGQRARKLLAGTPQHGAARLKNSRPGQVMRLSGQPVGQMGRPAARTGPLKQARTAASKPGGLASLREEPSTRSLNTKPGQAKEGEHKQLHPSWAAKKALAEKGGLMAHPQGTKVIFDGDDD
ncbi:hypothetical protein COCOBI_02-0310 [Coccomyxa sp. Obi]|nr:hypothetical protein COCOBI_02-0310 [Coccomyxa sp. Obi]